MKFEESNLEFIFGNSWSEIIKIDEHSDYKRIPINNTKVVDFIGLYKNKTLFL